MMTNRTFPQSKQHRNFLTIITAIAVLSSGLLCAAPKPPVVRARSEYRLPEIPGYVTLKCDFHMHTVFSDGTVWPTVRAEEAWLEGLDAIAITDHIEYQRFATDIPKKHNRSYEVAAPAGKALDILVIKGSEITRSMPPGHLNAIFLNDSNPLETKEWRDAVKAAQQQGAFIFWNHPGWVRQLVDGKIQWFPEHTELLKQGQLHGIEVANNREYYYPEAHRWAIEHKLTLLGDSDMHPPSGMNFHRWEGDYRPITLVFAAARTQEAIKDALFARQTAVITNELLLGDERFVRPIVERSLTLKKNAATLVGKATVLLQLSNVSDLNYELETAAEIADISLPKTVTVPAGKTVIIEIQSKSTKISEVRKETLSFKVKNVLPHPDHPLVLNYPLEITFVAPAAKK